MTSTSSAITAGLAGYGIGTKAGAGDMVEVDGGDFNYDDKILVETSQERGYDFSIRPIGAIVNTTPKSSQTFVIEPLVDRYLQNNKTTLEMRVKVTKRNGDRLSPFADIVAPVNLLGQLMWESVEVKLNGHSFSGTCNSNSGLKAFIDTVLSTEDDARHTHTATQLMHMDSAFAYDDFGLTAEDFFSSAKWELERGGITPFPAGLLALREVPAAGEAELTEQQKENTYQFTYSGDDGRNKVAYIKAQAAADWIMAEGRKTTEAQAGDNPLFRLIGRTCEIDRPHKDRNKGFQTRLKLARFSEEINVVTPIPHDFFNLNNHIGPGNRIEVTFTPYKDSFVLNSHFQHEGYTLQIVDMKMHLRTIERRERIHPPLVERYRMNQTELVRHPVAQGMTTYGFRVHHSGPHPKTLVFAFNDTRAIEGDYARNPVHFPHFNLRRIQLSVNGEIYPSGGLNFDFQRRNPLCSWGYHWLFENTGALLTNRGNMVTMDQFVAGCFIVPFDLTPDKCNGIHNHKCDYGYIDVELDWAEPLPGGVTVLVEKVFNKLVINDKLNSQMTVLDVEA